ncbi:MAG: ArnT family glycosyltransferase, partial [Candidatus Hodarchaeota archaeon]
AFISVFYPLLIFSSGLLYVEALFTFFISLTIYYVFKIYDEGKYVWFSTLAGLFLGLAALARPVIFSFYPFLALWVLVILIKPFKKRLTSLALTFSSAVLVITPWTIRNYNVFGRFVPVSAEVDHELSAVVETSLELETILQMNVVGDELKIVLSSDSKGHHFDFYINGQYEGRLTDAEKLQGNAQTRYSGIVLKGGLNNNVDEFSVLGLSKEETASIKKDTDNIKKKVDNFERKLLGPSWDAASEYEIISGELANTATEKSWKFLAVYASQKNPTEIAIKWGKTADGKGVTEAGLALMLDKPSTDASGYFVRRAPLGLMELWTIVDGAMGKFIDKKYGIYSIQNPWNQNRLSKLSTNLRKSGTFEEIQKILTSDPKTFFRRYFSEFIHFWSLYPDRVEAKNKFTGNSSKLISIISFAPILSLFLIGLLFSFPKWRKIYVLFFIIISFALGYSFFQTRLRYRIPVEPYIIIFAANGLVILWERAKHLINSFNYKITK